MFISRVIVVGLIALLAMLPGCGSDESPATEAVASVERGQKLYMQCRACHSLNEGGPNKVGPNLFGVFGRKAGLTPGFAYSDALANSDVIWTQEAMAEWLTRPSQFLPGNRMIFVGIKDAQDRTSLIAYLQRETGAK
jgi:cytochrome c